MDASELNELSIVNLVLNVVSGLCGLTVVGIIASLMVSQPKVMDRVSIRFTLMISLVDFLKAGVIVAYVFVKTEGSTCVALAFGTQWLTLLYLSLNVSIAINLQLVFIEGQPFNPKWEKSYWIASFLFPTIILLVPLALGKLGHDSTTESCEYRTPGDGDAYFWLWACWLFWMLAACIYCGVVVALSILSLKRKASILDLVERDRLQKDCRRHAKVKRVIKRLILRISLYCIIPTLTQIWFVVFKVYWHHTHHLHKTIIYLSVVGSDLPGLLNLLALFMDPAFSNAIKAARQGPERSPSVVESQQSTFSQKLTTAYATDDACTSESNSVAWKVRLLQALGLRNKDPGLNHQASISDISLENMGLKERPLRNMDGSRRVSVSSHHPWATANYFPPIAILEDTSVYTLPDPPESISATSFVRSL